MQYANRSLSIKRRQRARQATPHPARVGPNPLPEVDVRTIIEPQRNESPIVFRAVAAPRPPALDVPSVPSVLSVTAHDPGVTLRAWVPRAVFALLPLLFILAVQARAATVTGQVSTIWGAATPTNITIRPYLTPNTYRGTLTPSTPATITTTAGGAFSTTLIPGQYAATISGAARDTLLFVVPNFTLTNPVNLTDLIISTLPQPYNHSPSNQNRIEKGQPGGYAPLGADGLLPPSCLPSTAATVDQLNTGLAGRVTQGEDGYAVIPNGIIFTGGYPSYLVNPRGFIVTNWDNPQLSYEFGNVADGSGTLDTVIRYRDLDTNSFAVTQPGGGLDVPSVSLAASVPSRSDITNQLATLGAAVTNAIASASQEASTNVPAWAGAFFTQPSTFVQSSSNFNSSSVGSVFDYTAISMWGVIFPFYTPTNADFVRLWLRPTSGIAFKTNVNVAFHSNIDGASIWASNINQTIGPSWTEVVFAIPPIAAQYTQSWFRVLCGSQISFMAAQSSNWHANPWLPPLSGQNGYEGGVYTSAAAWGLVNANPNAGGFSVPQKVYNKISPYLTFGRVVSSTTANLSSDGTNAVAAVANSAITNRPYYQDRPLITLPPVIYGVAGREVNIYADGLVHDPKANAVLITAAGGAGVTQDERWYAWGAAQTTTASVTVYDKASPTNVLATATTSVQIVQSNLSGGSNVVFLAIGDSTTSYSQYLDEMKVIDAADSTISLTTIGMRVAGSSRNEGFGGWRVVDFATNQAAEISDAGAQFSNWKFDRHTGVNTTNGILYYSITNQTVGGVANTRVFWLGRDSTLSQTNLVAFATNAGNGTLVFVATNSSGIGGSVDITYSASVLAPQSVMVNPFIRNGTNWFDFRFYMTNSGQTTPTHVLLNLGINDILGQVSDSAMRSVMQSETNFIGHMVRSIHSNSPNARVGVCAVIPPSASQDAFGSNYGGYDYAAQRNYKRRWEIWNQGIIAAFSGQTGSKTYVVPLNTCLDTTYGMLWSSATNLSSRITNQVSRMSNGVHPGTPGYQQEADALAAWVYNTVSN